MNEIQQLLATLPKRKMPQARYNKPESVKQFEREYDNWYFKEKDLPYTWAHKFRDDTANELTKLICAWCKVNGHFAARVNTTGIYDVKRGCYRTSGARKGMADITAVINSKHISIEVKTGHDRPRPNQLKVKQEVEAAGGVYLFAHSFDDFLNQIKNIQSWKRPES
jgi:hypothetical protein